MVTLDQGGRGRGALRLFAPALRLQEVVEHLWVQRPLSGDSAAWRIVADDAPCLVGSVSTRGVRFALVGARTRHVDADVSRRLLTVGVRLRPGAIRALFGPSADEFTDRSYWVEDVVGAEPSAVGDALAAVDARTAVQALVAFLEERAACGQPVDSRVAALMEAETYGRVDEAVERLGLSARTTRCLCREHFGMGLKKAWRIRRLHRALHLRFARPHVGWAQVAAEMGYADQPHLIRDFRAFLGETPTAFVARSG